MKSTIEKALQRQKEAGKAESEKQQQLDDNNQPSADSAEEPAKQDISAEKAENTAEKESLEPTAEATSVQQNLSAQDSEKDATSSDSNTNTENYFDIDLERLESLGFVTMANARQRINEEYREIKRKLLQTAFGPLSKTLSNANIIMVTSARPSEGKTFTAVNLALSIAAEQDKTVLLVDADVLKPNVLRTLGLEAPKGLMEYLLDDKPLSEFIYKTNLDKLRIIPAGSTHHLSTELLASDVMHDTVNEFSTRYSDRVVIIDTPPIIGINESAILANFAGQAVIVVEEGRSKLTDIQTTVERLNPELAVGFVVNKSIKISDSGSYYGYYYYGHEDKKDS